MDIADSGGAAWETTSDVLVELPIFRSRVGSGADLPPFVTFGLLYVTKFTSVRTVGSGSCRHLRLKVVVTLSDVGI